MKFTQRVALRYIRTKFKLLSSISKKKAAENAFELFCTPQSRHVKELPAVFKEGEKLQFKFQQFSIVGYRWNKGASRTALIAHGFESSAVNFDRYVNALVKKGYEVLAFDAPAHGKSTGKQINAIIYRDFIKYIHQKYGPIQTFIAHSFGGLAVMMALAEIKHDANYRVILIAPASETSTALDHFFKFIHINDGAVRDEFEKIIVKMSGQQVSWFSIRRTLQKIKAKILWLHDEDDKITPLKDVYPIKKESHPNIRFVITKGLGHRRIYRDSQVTKTITDFV
ncbi:alpha/beta hydrolase [Terrimonas pollutisoli]|uniref:alpha/beta hydrolase n=1 Tax=Terrimonas pollutisoli TaxID=3034147 RepID=UPI0023ED5DB5|nr:alpha/beta fold hydrolase [Terrimonas sp. H1YJ31]